MYNYIFICNKNKNPTKYASTHFEYYYSMHIYTEKNHHI